MNILKRWGRAAAMSAAPAREQVTAARVVLAGLHSESPVTASRYFTRFRAESGDALVLVDAYGERPEAQYNVWCFQPRDGHHDRRGWTITIPSNKASNLVFLYKRHFVRVEDSLDCALATDPCTPISGACVRLAYEGADQLVRDSDLRSLASLLRLATVCPEPVA